MLFKSNLVDVHVLAEKQPRPQGAFPKPGNEDTRLAEKRRPNISFWLVFYKKKKNVFTDQLRIVF